MLPRNQRQEALSLAAVPTAILNELHRWVDPRVASVRVEEIRSYLLGRNWSLRPNSPPHQLVFEEPPGDPDGPMLLRVPASEALVDYPQRIVELITELAELEDRYAVAVLDDILRQRSPTPSGSNGPVQPAVLGAAPR